MDAPLKYQAAIESEALSAVEHVAKWRHEFRTLRACLSYSTHRAQGARIGWSKRARAALTFAIRDAVKKAW